MIVPGCACAWCFEEGGRVPRWAAKWPNGYSDRRTMLFGPKYTAIRLVPNQIESVFNTG